VGCFCDTEGEPIGCKELGNSSIVSGGEDGEPSVSELPSDECIEPCFVDEVVFTDIGYVLKPTMTSAEVESVMQSMGSSQKYQLLTNHFVPSSTFAFPKVFDSGCNRSFKVKWLERYPWLVYSKALDGGFCIYCALFAKERSKYSVLVNKPFTKWVKVNKIVSAHASNKYHNNALVDARAYIQSIEKPDGNVNVRLNTEIARNIQENRHIVKCCAESVLFCGRQCIALRGDKSELGQTGNPGNFLSYLYGIAKHDPQLKLHLESPKFKNATYVSPKIQKKCWQEYYSEAYYR
jgi:hypothetical protein